MSSEVTLPGHAGPRFWAPRALASDVLLTAAVLFVELGPVIGNAPPWHLRSFAAVDALALAGTSLPLLLRRRYPMAALAAVIASFAAAPILGLGLLVAFYSVGAWSEGDRRSVIAVSAGALLAISSAVVTRNVGLPFDAAIGLSAVAIAWYLGVLSRVRRRYTTVLEDRARSLEAERRADRARATAEERTRIARELHDIVAHRVSMMTVQAAAAGVVAGTDPHAAREAIASVEHAGREALSELRQLVAVLRTDDDPADPLEPGHSLGEVDSLVQDMRRAGVEVDLQVQGVRTPLADCLDSCSYRIVQEALTNVLKHAGPDADASVVIRYGPQDLEIEVTDTGDVPVAAPDSPGYGIIGMQERAAAFGGSVQAGPRAEGGYAVRARIPILGDAT